MDACQLIFAGNDLKGRRIPINKHGAGLAAWERIKLVEIAAVFGEGLFAGREGDGHFLTLRFL
jgi:hypothetical protein